MPLSRHQNSCVNTPVQGILRDPALLLTVLQLLNQPGRHVRPRLISRQHANQFTDLS